jgi:para-aminobenzoate synthetase component 1
MKLQIKVFGVHSNQNIYCNKAALFSRMKAAFDFYSYYLDTAKIEVIDGLDLKYIFSQLEKRDGVVYFAGSKDFQHGRYQYLAWNPRLTVEGVDNHVRLVTSEKNVQIDGNLIAIVEGIWCEEVKKIERAFSKIDNDIGLPFLAGAFGYFSYDLRDSIEPIDSKAVNDLDMPDVYLRFYDHVLVYDQIENIGYIVSINSTVHKNVKKYVTDILEYKKSVRVSKKAIKKIDATKIQSSFTKKQYMNAFKQVKQALLDGNAYILNLAQRLEIPFEGNGKNLFLELLESHCAPYAAYISSEKFEICSISPERFMNVQNSSIETCPIKGTIKRGVNSKEDKKLKQFLLDSEKEAAELSMVVDLERNDLGRICKYGTVEVMRHREAIAYPTLWQIVSTVRGELNINVNIFDVIRATFPGGSITGTPKLEAMKIIEKLEPVKRAVYTGSIGWLDYRGNMDLSIAIRTIVKKDNMAYLHVGGGIVIDSDAESEYQETWLKAKALLEALEKANY